MQLKHLPTGIVIKCQETRSRDQNRKIARQLLALKLEEIEKGSESRVAKLRERDTKKKASKSKKARRKYRKLEEEKNSSDTHTKILEKSRDERRPGEELEETDDSKMSKQYRLHTQDRTEAESKD